MTTNARLHSRLNYLPPVKRRRR